MKTEWFVEYTEIDLFSEAQPGEIWKRVSISFESNLAASEARFFLAHTGLVKHTRIAKVETVSTSTTSYE